LKRISAIWRALGEHGTAIPFGDTRDDVCSGCGDRPVGGSDEPGLNMSLSLR
jgi:hypothetical protein